MTRKFRRRRRSKTLKVIIPIKQSVIKKEADIQFDHEYPLSETERTRYTYTRNKQNKITNIVCVSYDLYIKDEWVTVIYYDSEHGSLHRHETISLKDRNEVVTEENVKKKGSKETWLTWAIKDIQTRYLYYRKLFLTRSNFNSRDL